jgi:hypothetical protein
MKVQTNNRDPSNSLIVPIGDILSRVGHELGHLARLLEHLETLVGPLTLDAASKDANFMHHMQGFDHIGQKMSGLSAFLAALAPDASSRWLVDPTAAARVVTLADLASRLAFVDEDQPSCSTAMGDCELF